MEVQYRRREFYFTSTDESRLKIALDEIPAGTYKLYLDITDQDRGCIFSLWQGQSRICSWINTYKRGKEKRVSMLHTGDISVGESNRSLTIQFKTTPGTNTFLLSRFIFVKKKN